jgi:hypothetical protein
MINYAAIKENLLRLSDSSLDISMIQLVKNWSSPFKAIEILEVLDKSIFEALASGSVIKILEILLNDALKLENLTHDELVIHAHWRNNP